MGINKDFFIEFENTDRSYFPGQNIRGKVVLITKKDRKLEGITIRFEGSTNVGFSQYLSQTPNETEPGKTIRGSKSMKKISFTDNEYYFDCKIQLFGNGAFVEIETLRGGGRYEYPFDFTLPLRLPSSFVGSGGLVYYYCEAAIKQSWKKDEKISYPFTVNGILDLNTEPGSNQPTEIRKYKNLCCLCFKNGPIGFKFQLERKGWCPGETIRFDSEWTNQSRNIVKNIFLKLVQIVTYHAKGNSQSQSNIICKIKGPNLPPGEIENWTSDQLKIPSVPPTRLASCLLIDIQYVLQIEMDIKGLTRNLKGEISFTIGTIPLRTTFLQLSSRPPQPHAGTLENVQNFRISSGFPQQNLGNNYVNIALPLISDSFRPRSDTNQQIPTAPTLADYPDLPLPTYAEAMLMSPSGVNPGFQNENSVEESGQGIYKPRYVTYGSK